MSRSVYTLSIPSSTSHLSEVREFVAGHAREADFGEDDVEQFKIAVDEACTNIIKHAYNGDVDRQIDLAIIVDEDRFTVRIRDEGHSFRPRMYTEPDIFKFAESRRAGGFGVHIMRRLMDRVEYSSKGDVNEVLLTKFRNGEKPDG
ncbi:MAG: ATP-binding protein [Rhodothermales bacterium]